MTSTALTVLVVIENSPTQRRQGASDGSGSSDDARAYVFEYIEIDYNRNRLHSTLGYLCPEAFDLAKAALAGFRNSGARLNSQAGRCVGYGILVRIVAAAALLKR